MNELAVREGIVAYLKDKGYGVEAISAGQGVPRLSRLALTKDDSRKVCVIKFSTGGRISFARDAATNSFKVLPEVDLILHAQPETTDPRRVRIMMFDKSTVQKAFDENQAALEANDMGHIPSWVNPEREGGWRQTGSGFKDKALWTDVIVVEPAGKDGSPIAPKPESSHESESDSSGSGFMDRIKAMVAAHLGVPADRIDIDIRFKS